MNYWKYYHKLPSWVTISYWLQLQRLAEKPKPLFRAGYGLLPARALEWKLSWSCGELRSVKFRDVEGGLRRFKEAQGCWRLLKEVEGGWRWILVNSPFMSIFFRILESDNEGPQYAYHIIDICTWSQATPLSMSLILTFRHINMAPTILHHPLCIYIYMHCIHRYR